MKNLVFAIVAMVAAISVKAHAQQMCEATGAKAKSYKTVKIIDATLSYDAKAVSNSAPVQWAGAVTLKTAGQVDMSVSHISGEAVYSVERIVRHSIAANECVLGNQTPGLPERVSCAIALPGKVITVGLTGAGNIVDGIIVDVLVGIPSNIMKATADLLAQTGASLNSVHGLLGVPMVVLSGILTDAGAVLQMVAYIVQTAVKLTVNTAVAVVCAPFKAMGQLLNGRPDQALYSATFGLVEAVFTTVIGSLPPLPTSPCNGVGRDKGCLK